MNRLSNYIKDTLRPYITSDASTARRYIDALRVAYGFSAGALFILAYKVVETAKEEEKKSKEENEDESQIHQSLRKLQPGLIFSFNSGLKTIEFNKETYLEQLEKDAIKKESKDPLTAKTE